MRGKRAIINQMEDLPLMRRRRRGAGRRMRGMRRLTYAGKCSQPKAFSLRRSLLVSALTNYRYPPRQISPSNQPPRGTLIADQRRAGEARPRGKAGSERRKACFHPGGSGFHLPRGAGGQGHSQFYQLDFYVTTQPSLILSWAPRKNRSPIVSLYRCFICRVKHQAATARIPTA